MNPAWSQIPPTVSGRATASIVTVLPGEDVYNVFGHTAIRISDPETRFDALFNYGTFDFTPGFVPKFVRGQLDYSLSVSGTFRAIEFYAQEERTVIEQKLNLLASEVEQLYQFLRINSQPENRYYRYDFFFDNCSTRIRDVLNTVLGDAVSLGGQTQNEESFRDLLHPYLVDRPFLSTGIDLVIGSDADRTATESERTFLPIELMDQLATADLGDRELVSATDTLYSAPDKTKIGWNLLYYIGWLLPVFVVALMLTRRDNSLLRVIDVVLYSITGIAGLAILGLWFATDHVVTDANLNLAWALPLNLLVVILGRKPRYSRHLRWYLIPYSIVLAIVTFGWPFWPQDLPDSLLPIVVLLLVRSIDRVRTTRPTQG